MRSKLLASPGRFHKAKAVFLIEKAERLREKILAAKAPRRSPVTK
jgi:hypothetical protein